MYQKQTFVSLFVQQKISRIGNMDLKCSYVKIQKNQNFNKRINGEGVSMLCNRECSIIKWYFKICIYHYC